MADLALSLCHARSRQASDQFAKVHFADTEVDYRDDNRHLWTFIEAGDEEESFSPPPSLRPATEASRPAAALLPGVGRHRRRRFPARLVQLYTKPFIRPAIPADIDRLLAKNMPCSPASLKRLLDLLKPQDRVRLRFQEDGSELDLDVAVRALDRPGKSGHQPESRINVSHRTELAATSAFCC